jgi:hypothetical protein
MIRSLSDPKTYPPIVMTELTDPDEIAKMNALRAQADRNRVWLQAHAHEIYAQNRGKFFCVAGQELFVADTPDGAMSAARTKHPDDQGLLLRFVPLEKRARV